jgi:UDP-glucose 4-epimerase
MRVLVTGGAGFIGSHVAQAALQKGWTVGLLDNLSTGRRENLFKEADFFEVDLRDADAVRRCIAHFRPEAISHQAAQASVTVSMRNPRVDAEVNVIGGLNLLEAAREHDVSQIVYASTGGAIYGEVPEGEAAGVHWPARPLSPYAASKLAFEHYLQVYAVQYEVSYTVLRYANVYGPRQDPHGEAGVVAIFAERLLQDLTLQINAMHAAGDPGCLRDYVYVGDIVKANMAALEGRCGNRLLNVATGIATSTQALAELLGEIGGNAAKLTFAAPRPGDVKRSVLDPGDFYDLIGQPTMLLQGLRKTLDWFRHH